MQHTVDVLVVGAAPVGLMAAAELRRHGVGCRIIDRLPEPMSWVKALGVSPRTLEVWDAIGVVNEALDAGMLLERSRVFINRESALDADVAVPGAAPYRYHLSLPQHQTERILREHLAKFGVQVEPGAELQSFSDVGDAVE